MFTHHLMTIPLFLVSCILTTKKIYIYQMKLSNETAIKMWVNIHLF